MPSGVFLARCVLCQMSGRAAARCCWCRFPLDTLCVSVSHCLCTWLRTTSAVWGEQMSEYSEGSCSKQTAGRRALSGRHWACLWPTITGVFWGVCLAQLAPLCPYQQRSACWVNVRGSQWERAVWPQPDNTGARNSKTVIHQTCSYTNKCILRLCETVSLDGYVLVLGHGPVISSQAGTANTWMLPTASWPLALVFVVCSSATFKSCSSSS